MVDAADEEVALDKRGDMQVAEAEVKRQTDLAAAAEEKRARTVEGLRHIGDMIDFFKDALAYVRENGHGNAEGVLLRVLRDLEALRAVPLPLSDEELAASQEDVDPIVALQRDNADLRRRLGQLELVSPHAFVNTTRTLRPLVKAPDRPTVDTDAPSSVNTDYVSHES